MSIPKQWALWDNIITDAMEMMLRKAYYVHVLKCTRNWSTTCYVCTLSRQHCMECPYIVVQMDRQPPDMEKYLQIY
jgi:hypothetical protein